MQQYSWAWILFSSYIMITSFTVINLMVAVICDAVGETQRQELEGAISKIDSFTNDSQTLNKIKMLEAKVDRLALMLEKL